MKRTVFPRGKCHTVIFVGTYTYLPILYSLPGDLNSGKITPACLRFVPLCTEQLM